MAIPLHGGDFYHALGFYIAVSVKAHKKASVHSDAFCWTCVHQSTIVTLTERTPQFFASLFVGT